MEKGQLDRLSMASGLRPQRLEPRLAVRSQSLPGCRLQAKPKAASLGGRLSSLDPQPVGRGARNYAASFLVHAIPVHQVCTSSLQMKKAQTGLVAGPGSHSTLVV